MDIPPDYIRFSQEQKGEISVVHLKGKLDANSADEVEKKLIKEIKSGKKKLLLNLTGVDYMSSAGMRVLLKTSRQAEKESGKIVLTSLNKQVMEVLAISGLDRYFDIACSDEEGIGKIE